MVIAIFERKVRSGRGANRAVTKAQQANIDKTTNSEINPDCQLLVFRSCGCRGGAAVETVGIPCQDRSLGDRSHIICMIPDRRF